MALFGNPVRLNAPELLRPIRPATFGQAVGGFFNNFMHPNTSTTLGRIGAMGQQLLARGDTPLGQEDRAAIAQRTAQQAFAPPEQGRFAPTPPPPAFRIGARVGQHTYLGGDPNNPASWRAY